MPLTGYKFIRMLLKLFAVLLLIMLNKQYDHTNTFRYVCCPKNILKHIFNVTVTKIPFSLSQNVFLNNMINRETKMLLL